jgi:hypothetical protein
LIIPTNGLAYPLPLQARITVFGQHVIYQTDPTKVYGLGFCSVKPL